MNGIINVLKPPGMTSSDIVVDIRRLLGIKKVGHTGTLDPGAAGVLPVCIGKATRLFDFLAEKDKEYLCEIRFGFETDTIDAYGKVTGTCEKVISEQMLKEALVSFTGDQEQIPPMYSALKVNGVKLCDLARRGGTTDLDFKKRTITIFSLDYVEQTAENTFQFKIHCSKGTYVRTLCNDIAASLGTCAYMSFLLRTRSGPFSLDESRTVAEIGEIANEGRIADIIVPMDYAVQAMRAVYIPDSFFNGLMQGNPIPRSCAKEAADEENLRLYCMQKFIGIGRAECDLIKVKSMLMDR